MGVILNNLIPIIGSSIAMSIPLVLASVGGAFSVRSGIMALPFLIISVTKKGVTGKK